MMVTLIRSVRPAPKQHSPSLPPRSKTTEGTSSRDGEVGDDAGDGPTVCSGQLRQSFYLENFLLA